MAQGRELYTDLVFLLPHAHDLKDGEGIRQWPEGGHNHQAEDDILAMEKRRTQPEKVGNEEAGAHPVQVMGFPSCVSQRLNHLIHAEPPFFNSAFTSTLSNY
jgi:hypothetical protein